MGYNKWTSLPLLFNVVGRAANTNCRRFTHDGVGKAILFTCEFCQSI